MRAAREDPVNQHTQLQDLKFYMTAPGPCPYLPGRVERKVFTHVADPEAEGLNDTLSQAGFRRSQQVLYRPACPACEACVSVRARAGAFTPTRSQKRVRKRNAGVLRAAVPAHATDEQFALLTRYLTARHDGAGMSDMSFGDYALMAGEAPSRTEIIEYRDTADGPLIAAIIVDRLGDGLSLVYSFFDPDLAARSLGSFMVMDQIARAAQLDLPYVYLGYWIAGSEKMDYKTNFRPIETLTRQGWREFEGDA